MGSAALVEGKLQVHETDKKNQIAIKDSFLAAADLLDKLPERARAKTYPKSDKNLDNLLPNYLVDALRYAQEKKTHILTDDFFLVHAYEKIEEIPMPRHFSSLSLIKAMAMALRQGCRQNMMDERWINNSSKQKLEMLDKQLFRIETLGAQHSLIIP